MKGYIRQIGQKDCAFASLKMVLAHVHSNDDYLYYEQQKADNAYSLFEIINIGKREGVELKAFKAINKEDIFNVKHLPIIIILKEEEILHTVVVKKVKKNKVLIFDSDKGIYYLSKKELLESWNGEYLTCNKICDTKYKKKKMTSILPKIRKIIPVSLHFLGTVSLLVSLYFSNNPKMLLLFILLISFACLCEMVVKIFNFSNLKFIDRVFQQDLSDQGLIFYKKHYPDIINMKVYATNFNIERINVILIVLFMFFILILNNTFNSIFSIILIFLSIIDYEINRTYLSSKKYKIAKHEKALLLNNATNVGFINNLKIVNSTTYKYGAILSIKNSIFLVIIFILTIINMYLVNSFSLNYIIFTFFSYYFLYDNLTKLISFEDKKEEEKKLICLYRFLCKEI